IKEAFVTAMGDKGEKILQSDLPLNEKLSMRNRFLKVMHEFWAWIGQKLGIRDLTPEQIRNLTFEQAVQGAVSDLFSGKRIVESQLEAVNERFNKELQQFDNRTLKGDLHLGKPLEILQAAGVKASEITLSQPVLSKKLAEHGLTIEDLNGLAKAIQNPIMVYEWGTRAKSTVIVTELTTTDGRKITVAIKAERKGETLLVNDVASVHGKTAERFLSEMENAKEGGLKEALRYVEKEKALDWLGLALPNGASSQTNEGLNQVAKIIKNFENPKIEGKIAKQENYDLENSEKNSIFAEQNNFSNDNRGKQYASNSVSRTFEEAIREINGTGKNRGNIQTTGRTQQAAGTSELLGNLERLAKRNGAWIERPEELILFNPIGKGFENEVFPSSDKRDVIKFNNLSVSETLNNFLDRIKAHNEFAPNAAYTILGIGKNSQGETTVILKQPRIEANPAPIEKVMQFLKDNGFKPAKLSNGADGFRNDQYEISDLWKNDGGMMADNVLVDNEGNLYFIDADINRRIDNGDYDLASEAGGIRFHIKAEKKPELKDYASLLEWINATAKWLKQNTQTDRTLIETVKSKEFRSEHNRLQELIRDKNKSTRSKVNALTDFIRNYLSEGQLSNPDIRQLLTKIKNATTTNDIEKLFYAAYDQIAGRHIKNLDNATHSLLDVKATRKNSRGQVEGRVIDNDTRIAADVIKDNMHKTEADIQGAIAEQQDVLENKQASEAKKADARAKINGLNIAASYAKVNSIREKIRETTDGIKNSDNREIAKLLEEEARTLRQDLSIDIAEFNHSLREFIENGKGEFKRQAEKRQKDKEDLLHKANSATKGVKQNKALKPKGRDAILIERVASGMAAPLQSLNHILKRISIHAPNGESELYYHFMQEYIEAASTEYENMIKNREALADKIHELFGFDRKQAVLQALEMSKMFSGQSVDSSIGNTQLSYGRALTILLWHRQKIGRATLMKMGIDDGTVSAIRAMMNETEEGRAFLALGDWMANEFIPGNYSRYNESYREFHNTDLGREDNYFPIKRHKKETPNKKDVGSKDVNTIGSTASATRARTHNLLALDINQNALDILLSHIKEMEHETAFRRMTEDLNVLSRSRTFRNKLETLHGNEALLKGKKGYEPIKVKAGKDLYERFIEAANVAVGSFEENREDNVWTGIIKNVNTAKITLRR
ncbi:MAG: hypothetical protein LBL07_09635, partial [Tannerella sp.]|nr:hypothetical protein [Tannerella sp.]